MRWTRDQYLALMTGNRPPRPMFVELFGPLVGLEDEWHAQGATPGEIALTAFDFDYVPIALCGGHTGPLVSPPVTISETSDMLVQRDYLGRTIQLDKRTATIPLPLDFPVRTMDDWLRLKPLFTFNESRIDEGLVEKARRLRADGHLVRAGIPGAFDVPRELMGEEHACMAYYDDPELMHDILQTISDTSFEVLSRISEQLHIDQLSVHEDFAGRSGPLVGPTQIDDYFRPYYSRIWDLLRSRGATIFQQDSDGNLNSVVDALRATGLTSIYPNEPAAGMDIVALRKQYPDLMLLGGIDKHVLRQSRAAIARELEYKMQPLMQGANRVVFGLDHRIPNGTPLDNYRLYVNTAREILGIPPLEKSPTRAWQRMAF
jgi:uroporphyrinogen-III decarboxylase